jgi:Leucine-rich repeat (LRR) protein
MKRLLLRENQIILVPTSISNLEQLHTFDLRDNLLNSVPFSIVVLKKLEKFNVSDSYCT